MLTKEIYELSAKLGEALVPLGWTVTTVESCTGGGIASAITDIAGSSGWFEQGVVTYSNEAKQSLVKVSLKTLQDQGAVSEQTVREMLTGAVSLSAADVAIAVSGIAGPGGGTEDKPVGTVWIGCWVKEQIRTERYCFAGDRDEVRVATVKYGLLMVLEMINKWQSQVPANQ